MASRLSHTLVFTSLKSASCIRVYFVALLFFCLGLLAGIPRLSSGFESSNFSLTVPRFGALLVYASEFNCGTLTPVAPRVR
jgi:hypothetical protein